MEIYELVGAAMEVYNELGRGMEEPIYQEAMARELSLRGVEFEREKLLRTYYKGQLMDKVYQADFISNNIIVEFKSVSTIIADHRAQLFNYMRITKLRRGILVNFGEDHFHAERYIYDETTDSFKLITKENLHLYVKS
ncbi:MAG: GxxExxY protein [Prevotellaceae bacterium]|nr:GxxExxY protein [Candidatus Minthosoma caballi]